MPNGNQQRYIDDYKKQHYDRINIFLPKGYKDSIKRLAAGKNLSVSKFILECIESQYEIEKTLAPSDEGAVNTVD